MPDDHDTPTHRDAFEPMDPDEDILWAAATAPAAPPADRRAAPCAERQRDRVARLVARVYRAAGPAGRAQVLACLLRPLSTLSLAAVAAGAFGAHLHRQAASDSLALLAGAANHTRDQVQDLVRFVQEVNPDALQPLVDLLAGDALGMAGFSAAAAALLFRQLQGGRGRGAMGPR